MLGTVLRKMDMVSSFLELTDPGGRKASTSKLTYNAR